MTEDPAHVDARLFAHSNSAPVRVEREGGTAAWLVGTLGSTKCAGTQTTSVEGYGPISVFFEPLVAGNQKASLASVSP